MEETFIPAKNPALPLAPAEGQEKCRSEINSDPMGTDQWTKQKTNGFDHLGDLVSGAPAAARRSDESITPLTDHLADDAGNAAKTLLASGSSTASSRQTSLPHKQKRR